MEKNCGNYSVLKFILCKKNHGLDLVIFGLKIDKILNRARKNDCPTVIFLTEYEVQGTVTYTVFLQCHWYLNSSFYLYYAMLFNHAFIW